VKRASRRPCRLSTRFPCYASLLLSSNSAGDELTKCPVCRWFPEHQQISYRVEAPIAPGNAETNRDFLFALWESVSGRREVENCAAGSRLARSAGRLAQRASRQLSTVNDLSITWLCLVAPPILSQFDFQNSCITMVVKVCPGLGVLLWKHCPKGWKRWAAHWHQTSFVECNTLVHHEC